MNAAIEREAILPRIDGIRKNLTKLKKLSELPFEDFSGGDAFDLAQHHLRLALEGVFHISSHILSRIPGGRATEYKEIARKLGEHRIVPESFARQSLVPMAGMRNILVHAYSDIDARQLYETVRNHREDIEIFLKHVGAVLKNPESFGLSVN
ncbi:MAG TPA: hypothetical protein DF383_11905 [Deltaproteobacteria bacterium]|nr:hypothetical protein [Deltaproteobacteria bacterium]